MTFKIKVRYKLFFIGILIVSYFTTYSQELIKTSEYINEKKRRDLFYDNNMKLVKEIYYGGNTQKIVNILKYDSLGDLSYFCMYENFPQKKIEVDFKSGFYKNHLKNIELNFSNDFLFNGQQKGDKIIVNYKDGFKSGKLIQTDSGISGKKTVIYQRVDTRYLKFNILKFYNDYGTEDTYKLFNGVVLNFKNNVLDGNQKSFYLNGNLKFTSKYSNGLILEHTSFNNEKNILSKIITDSGIIKGPVVINGTLKKFDQNNIFNKIILLENKNLDKTGDIIRESLYSTKEFYNYYLGGDDNTYFFDFVEKYGKFDKQNLMYNDYEVNKIYNTKELKLNFDDKKLLIPNGDILRIILSIPDFSIRRLDFQNDENFEINRVDTLNLNNFYNKNIISNSFLQNDTISYLVIKDPYKELTSTENYIFFKSIIENTIDNINELENQSYNFKNPFKTNIFSPWYGSLKFYYSQSEEYDLNSPLGSNNSELNNLTKTYFSSDKNIFIKIQRKNKIEFNKYDKRYVFVFDTKPDGNFLISNVIKYLRNKEVYNYSKSK